METRNFLAILCVFSIAMFVLASTPAWAGITTLFATEDAEIDQYYGDTNYGTVTSFRVEIAIDNYESWGLIKWDLSGIGPGNVTDVTLSIPQLDTGCQSVYVYGIQAGNWTESTVTWNNWVGTETVVLLGEMINLPWLAGNPTANLTTFANDNLTAWVTSWTDGSQANYGLLFKWADDPGYGDAYLAHDHTLNIPGKLIISNPEFCGDEGTVYVLSDLDLSCKVDWGDFSVFASQWLWCTDPQDSDCDQYWK